jgi:Cof subfamily protein (haloacid dehalogenase superfamily)
MEKIFVTDIDGTLTLNGDIINSNIINELERMYKNNIKIIFASGRSLREIQSVVGNVNFKYYSICSNGSNIYNIDFTKMYQSYIPDTIADDIIKKLIYDDMIFRINLDDELYSRCSKKLIDDLENLAYLTSHERKNLLDEMKIYYKLLYSNAKVFSEYIQLPKLHLISKIEVLGKNNKEYRKELSLYNSISITSSHISNLEISAKNVNKGRALSQLNIYDKENSKVYVMGDDNNDIELFKVSDYSFASFLAKPQIKEIADEILGDGLNSIIQGMEKVIKDDAK